MEWYDIVLVIVLLVLGIYVRGKIYEKFKNF